MIRVLIADDEPLIRAGISTVLSSAPDIDVVATADNGRSAVTEAIRHQVDVALLDIRMPVLDGLGALDELCRQQPSTRIVVLTAFGEEPNVLRAVRAGAAGFVLKNCSPDELINAVRVAHRGDAYLSPAVTRVLLGLVSAGPTIRRHDAAARMRTLSARETDVLRLVAEGLTNADIGRRLRMSEMSIKTYVSRILTKLDCGNRVQAALLVRDADGP